MLVAALFVGPLYLRAALESSRALESAEELAAAGQLVPAFDRYRVALSWSAPGLSAPETALERLYEIVTHTPPESPLYWDGLWALTRGLKSSASWAMPARRHEILRDVEVRLARELERRAPGAMRIEEPRAWSVSYSGQLLVQLSFWGWIGAALFAIWSGVTPDGAVRRGVFVRRFGLAIGWFMAWLGALSVA